MLRSMSLRMQLTVPYILLLLCLAAAVGWLSYRSADAAIDDMAAKLESALTDQIQEATSGYLTNWEIVLAAAAAEPAGPAEADIPQLERRLWNAGKLSAVRPSYVYFGATDGRFVGVQQGAEGPALLKLRQRGGGTHRQLFDTTAPGDRSHPRGEESSAYDATHRPWYQQAISAQGGIWSPVYLDYSSQAPMITLARAQRDDSGQIVGVFGADVPLTQVEEFLRALGIANQGLAYVVSREGELIASSLPAPANATLRKGLVRAAESPSSILRASHAAIGPQLGSRDPARLGVQSFVTPAGRMLVSATPLLGQPGTEWWVVVALREDTLTAGAARNAWRTTALAALACLATLALGTWILSGLARDVGRLTRAAEQLNMDATQPPLVALHRRDEIGRLADAFNQMSKRLVAAATLNRMQNEALVTSFEKVEKSAAERDQADQRLRGIADSLSEGLIVVDSESRLTYANALMQRYTWLAPADSVGRQVSEVLPENVGAEVHAALQEARKRRTAMTVELVSPMGDRRIELRIFPSSFGIAVFFSDITDRFLAREALTQRQHQLRRLANELLSSQAEERRSIARELHDELGQQLAAVRINLEVLLAQTADPVQVGRIDDSLAIVVELIAQVRDRALDLHPSVLDDLGLDAALQWLCERTSQRSGVEITLRSDPNHTRLPEAVELASFRIAQEAMSNALKHARSKRINIAIEHSATQVRLTIQDDGVGLAPGASAQTQRGPSLGMVGMRERAEQLGGTLTITSTPNGGTTVDARIPIEQHAQDHPLAG